MTASRSVLARTSLYAALTVIGAGGICVGVSNASSARTESTTITSKWVTPGKGVVLPAKASYPNSAGTLGVVHERGPIQTKGHPFFEPLGSNGRACVTCHQPSDAMSLSLDTIRERWEATKGADPLFDPVDGADCPDKPRGKRESHSLLLDHGLIRIAMPWPPKDANGNVIEPEFTLEVVRDPTGCNTSPTYGLNSDNPTVSVYRRPRMAANLRYVTTSFSLSGRFNGKTGEPLAVDPKTGKRVGLPILADARQPTLEAQAAEAAINHMRVHAPLTDEQIEQIVAFESQVYVAQDFHIMAGSLVEKGAPPALGPMALVTGESILPGNNWTNPVFMSFDSWRVAPGETEEQRKFRESVARGYDLFFLRPMWIRDVAWFNSIGMGNPYKRTCAICHSVHLTGNNISPGLMDLGVNNVALGIDMPDLPVFKVTCKQDALPHPYLGREFLTYDPGRALVTGKCIDVGSLVMQQMRGMSARAPFFSNGSAKTIREVVEYYDTRFDMKLTEQEKQDLTNFMSVL